jgi:DNA-directed RNA polymerase subunit RPC12/RpoP
MIKYGVLVEYKCMLCGEKIDAGIDLPKEELHKLASKLVHTECNHEWRNNEKESGSIRTE